MDQDPAARLSQLRDQIVELQEVAALQNLAELLRAGVDPETIMARFTEALNEIGRRYQAREYYMTALVLGGELVRQALSILMPHLIKARTPDRRAGLVILGTIEGDIHDLGKNMAGYFLKANGFDVVDLGVDVAPRTFLAEILKRGPDLVGVSLLLTTCVDPLRRLSRLLRETYEGQPDAPLLFAGCGFLRHGTRDSLPTRTQAPEWLGVDQVVTEVGETVKLCLAHCAAKRSI